MKCPSCGNQGHPANPADQAFEVRGEIDGQRTRKCNRCGAGMALSRLGRPKLIPDDVWTGMEDKWGRAAKQAEPSAEVAIPKDTQAAGGRMRKPPFLSGRWQPVLSTRTEFYGAVNATSGEIWAWVDVDRDQPAVEHGLDAIALLVPLAALKTMALMTSGAPQFFNPFKVVLRTVAESGMAVAEHDRSEFELADGDLPTFLPERAANPAAFWTADLMKGKRSGKYWVKGHGRMRGAPVFAIWGVLGLLRYAVRNCSYEKASLPALAAIGALTELTRYEDGVHKPSYFEEVISSVVFSPDPWAAAQEVAPGLSL